MSEIVSVHIAAWLACAVFVLGGVHQVLRVWDRLKGHAPEPPNECLEAGRRELAARVGRIEVDLRDLQRAQAHEREQAEMAARARNAKTYEKIEELRIEITGKVEDLRREMTTQFADTERALGRIEGALQRS